MTGKEFFGPLTLHQTTEKYTFTLDEPFECSCILCENKFNLPADKESLVIHLFTKHKLVISDLNDIADLKEYLRYWRLRFKGK